METATPRLVLVYGPAGIGKSRLTREFLAAARERWQLSVLTGRCLATGRGITYWALAEILQPGVRHLSRRLGRGSRDRGCVPAPAPPSPVSGFPRRSSSRPCSRSPRQPASLCPTIRSITRAAWVADELARAWPRFATALARATADDHRDRGPSLGGRAAGRDARAVDRPVQTGRCCCSRLPGRSSERPSPASRRAGRAPRSISLQALTESQAAALVDGLLRSVELPEELRHEIVRAAEGNPFFLEEIVLRLIDTGAIVREGDRWRAERRRRSHRHSRHRARRARRSDRRLVAGRETGAAGGGGRRPRVLAGAPRPDTRRGAGQRCAASARGSGPCRGATDLVARRPGRVPVQACARARRRLLRPAEGSSCARPRRTRCLAGGAGRRPARRARGADRGSLPIGAHR